MLISYSRDASLTEAARKTFDGGHPCGMCKLVEKSREDEKRQPLVKADVKLDVVLPAVVRLKSPAGTPHEVLLPDLPGSFREMHPAAPYRPPRPA
jgi:hypothetical protein